MRLLKPILLLGVTSLLLPSLASAKEPIAVKVQADAPGQAIPVDALGLSYETSLLRPDAKGVHYFRPGNSELVKVFQTIGVKSLRIGGNSVDDPKVPLPDKDDVRALFQFARKAGVKVI
ncbi:MAG TPA: hypothetical protein VF388_00960, partial [Lacunisphaera sp.]